MRSMVQGAGPSGSAPCSFMCQCGTVTRGARVLAELTSRVIPGGAGSILARVEPAISLELLKADLKHSDIFEGPILSHEITRLRRIGALIYPLSYEPHTERQTGHYAVWSTASKGDDTPPPPGKLEVGIASPDPEIVTIELVPVCDPNPTCMLYEGIANFRNHPGVSALAWVRSYGSGRHFITIAVSAGTVYTPASTESVRAQFRMTDLGVNVDGKGRLMPAWGPDAQVGSCYFPKRAILVRDFWYMPEAEAVDLKLTGEPLLRRANWRCPPAYMNFGPTGLPLPSRSDRKDAWDTRIRTFEAALAQGRGTTPDGESFRSIGPWIMVGDKEAYAHGGSGIRMGIGFQGNADAVWTSCALARLQTHRHRKALHDRTGRPVWASAWPRPIEYDLSSASGGDTAEIPYFGYAADTLAWNYLTVSSPEGESDLLSYRPHDGAHVRRITSYLQEAWWLAGDRFARWMQLQVAADLSTGEWSARGKTPYAATEGTWVPKSLQQKLAAARREPATGGWYGREFGWVLDALAAAWACMTPLERRDGLLLRDTGLGMLHLARVVATPFGFLQRADWRSFNPAIPEGDTGIQSFEWGIVCQGLAAGIYSFIGADGSRQRLAHEIAEIMELGCEALYRDTDPRPSPWGDGSVGPPHFVTTKRGDRWIDPPFPGFSQGDPSVVHGDPSHVWHALAVTAAFNLSKASDILRLSLRQWIPFESIEAQRAWISKVELPVARAQCSALEAVHELLAGARG